MRIDPEQVFAMKGALLDELEPAPNHNGRKGFVCPQCGSGTNRGRASTGAVEWYLGRDGQPMWYCHRCKASGDVYRLIEIRDGATFSQALQYLVDRYGGGNSGSTSDYRREAVQQVKHPARTEEAPRTAEAIHDFRGYLDRCAKQLPGSEGELYLLGRGFSRAAMQAAGLGFDPHAGYFDAGEGLYRSTRAVAIPYPGREGRYYVARTIGSDAPKYLAPRQAKAGTRPLFGRLDDLQEFDSCFIVEGEFDALSFQQAGQRAVALGGTDARKLFDAVNALPPGHALPRFIVALDADPAGRKAASELNEMLRGAGIAATVADVDALYSGRKDANAALAQDSDAFARAAADAVASIAGVAVDREGGEEAWQ